MVVNRGTPINTLDRVLKPNLIALTFERMLIQEPGLLYCQPNRVYTTALGMNASIATRVSQ